MSDTEIDDTAPQSRTELEIAPQDDRRFRTHRHHALARALASQGSSAPVGDRHPVVDPCQRHRTAIRWWTRASAAFAAVVKMVRVSMTSPGAKSASDPLTAIPSRTVERCHNPANRNGAPPIPVLWTGTRPPEHSGLLSLLRFPTMFSNGENNRAKGGRDEGQTARRLTRYKTRYAAGRERIWLRRFVEAHKFWPHRRAKLLIPRSTPRSHTQSTGPCSGNTR